MNKMYKQDDWKNQSRIEELEIALQESEEKFLSLYNSNHLIMLIIEPETGNIVDANPKACTYYGYSQEQIKKMKIFDINQLSKEQILSEMQLALKEKRNYFNFRHRLASGEIRNVEVYSGPIKIKGKKLLYSIIHDITDKVKMENALKENERCYRRLLELAPYAILVYCEEKIVFANSAALKILEAEEIKELLGLNIFRLISSEYQKSARKRIKNILDKKSSNSLVGYELLTLKGNPIEAEVVSTYFEFKGRPAVQTILIDTTERKKELERAAKIQRQRLISEFPLEDRGNLEILYRPAKFISGDLFHFYRVNNDNVVGILGDVMGKGITAALNNSALKVLFYDLAGKLLDPKKILEELNREIPKFLGEEYVAASCFSFDFKAKTCKIAAAGINKFSYKLNGKISEEIMMGSFLGMFKDSIFESKVFNFKGGDIFYFYTDGMEDLLAEIRMRDKFTLLSTIKEQKEFLDFLIVDKKVLKDDITWLGIEIL